MQIYRIVMKNCLTILLFLLVLSATAQDASLLASFDKISLSGKQSEIENYMAAFPGFSQSKVTDAWAEIEYLGLEYKGPKEEDIVLLFYNGVLYQKQLIVYYPVSGEGMAKDAYLNLKKHIITANKVLDTSEEVISNQIYGSQVGEGSSYFLDMSPKNYQVRQAIFSAKLDAGYDDVAKKPTAKLAGYKVIYKATDLSKTALDAAEGFKSY